MTFHRNREFIKFDYCFDSFPLVRVTEVKDLVFIRVPSLDFRPLIDFVVCKALRVLGLIRRHSSNIDSPKYFYLLHSSQVKYFSENRAIVWFPYTCRDIRHLDKVQNFFLSFAGYHLNFPHPLHDYSHISNILDLKSLTERCIISSCCFINELVEGNVDALRLLERLDIRIPVSTRFKGLLIAICHFFVPWAVAIPHYNINLWAIHCKISFNML